MIVLVFWIFVSHIFGARASFAVNYNDPNGVKFKDNPAPDNHRCGMCPTYFQKICAFDHTSNSTYIFDNHCIMDLYNCMEGTHFTQIKYDNCIYFGNFAYVHGFKYEDMDYGEDHIVVKGSKKNPDFVRRFAGLVEDKIFDFSE